MDNVTEKVDPKKIIHDKLASLRERFRGGIPDNLDLNTLKSTWLTSVVGCLGIANSLGTITDPKITQEITAFTDHYGFKRFHSQKAQEAITRGDIEKANYALDLYLNNCKTK